MTRVLRACPEQPIVTAATARRPKTTTVAVAQPEPPPRPQPAPAPPAGGTDPRFDTCADAIAAGYGPYVEGRDPEYAWYRDGDSDGINCESGHLAPLAAPENGSKRPRASRSKTPALKYPGFPPLGRVVCSSRARPRSARRIRHWPAATVPDRQKVTVADRRVDVRDRPEWRRHRG